MKTILLAVATALLFVSGPAARSGAPARRNGVFQTRWPDGTLQREVSYRDGEYDGAYRTWYRSGRPYELRHYHLGHEDGLQQTWSETGELYINYEARNGRHFGLVNSTPCEPVEPEASGLPYYDAPEFTPRWAPVAHRIGAFALTTQTGTAISEQSLAGRIHVASFVYTRCAAVCPTLIAQLSRVQRAVQGQPNVLLVSYTVTPENDTPEALAAFGRDRSIDPKRWWLVTGQRDQIYRLARQSYFADDSRVGHGAAADGQSTDDAFLHTEKVLLVDGEGRLRGVYNGTQPHEIDQLIGDIGQLTSHK